MVRGREDEREQVHEEQEEEFEVDHIRDRIKSSCASRFNLLTNELGLDSSSTTRKENSRESVINGLKCFSHGVIIRPDNRYRLSLFLDFDSPKSSALFGCYAYPFGTVN